jgi:ribosomal protein S12 methylthiotransferase accessory factor
MRFWRELTSEELARLTAPASRHHVDYDSIVVRSGGPGASGPGASGTGTAGLSSGQPLLDHLLDALADHDVLAATVTVGGVSVAKVVVPGLEVETLSYGRIGEANSRDLLGTDLDLVRLQDRASVTHPDRIVLTPDAEERLGGPVWYSYAVAARLVGPLYPLYREPARHSVTLTDR